MRTRVESLSSSRKVAQPSETWACCTVGFKSDQVSMYTRQNNAKWYLYCDNESEFVVQIGDDINILHYFCFSLDIIITIILHKYESKVISYEMYMSLKNARTKCVLLKLNYMLQILQTIII
jgi:hypothetical protein